jgi:hypothetical protein
LQSVQDMRLLDPALVDAVARQAKLLNAMRVAIDNDLRAEFACPMQAHTMGVDLLWLEGQSPGPSRAPWRRATYLRGQSPRGNTSA